MADSDLEERLRKLEAAFGVVLSSFNLMHTTLKEEVRQLKEDIAKARELAHAVDKSLATKVAVDAVVDEQLRKDTTGAYQKAAAVSSQQDATKVEKVKSTFAMKTAVAVALIAGFFTMLKDLIIWMRSQ